MWNKKRSLALSKVSTLLFMALLAAAIVAAPWLVGWLTGHSPNASGAFYGLFLGTLYVGGTLAAAVLVCLYRMLSNIGKGLVFTRRNVSLLRGISWLCIAEGAVCTLSALYYFPWLIAGAAAAFIGLIVRVVKNVLAEAVALKEENDFTI